MKDIIQHFEFQQMNEISILVATLLLTLIKSASSTFYFNKELADDRHLNKNKVGVYGVDFENRALADLNKRLDLIRKHNSKYVKKKIVQISKNDG